MQLQAVINYLIKKGWFVSCCNKLGDLQLQKVIHSSSEAQKCKTSITVLKSKCWLGHSPIEGSRGESAPCFFQLLVAASIGTSWPVATSFQSLSPSSYHLLFSGSLSVFPLPLSY